MICEYRSYRLQPGRLQEYVGLFQAHSGVLDLLRPHLHGFWTAESGRLNVVHHLWRYESRQARANARAAIAAAPFTPKFFAAVTPLLQAQSSFAFEGELHAPMAVDPPGCYDLFEVSMRPDALPVASDRALADLGHALSQGFVPVATLRRGWLETAGPVAQALYIVRSTSFAERQRNCAAAHEGLALAAGRGAIAETSHALLIAAPFSPWR
jgi:hypothetical protein